MSAELENSLAILGQEVPLGQVDMALKELWGKDEARTRASLMNFAIYSEDPSSIEANTKLLEEITQEHACRGMLLLALPAGKPSSRAWITAHCQLHEGQKSVCSEQVSFLLEGGSMNQVRNIVFAHLDSDLPLVCWWQGDLSANFSERFYSVMDMLFIDSSNWSDPKRDFAALQQALSQTTARFRVYDLSWLRSHLFRTALASCFQDAVALAELPNLRRIEITHSTGHRLAGLLIAAWIAVRLKCKLDTAGGIKLISAEGNAIVVSLHEGAGDEALLGITLASGRACFTVSRSCGAAYVCTKVVLRDLTHEAMLPADLVKDSALISEQLSRLGWQSLYIQMVPMLQEMLAAE
ncbi:MAG: glucose-6-phosphate dehydrogenase assembly protein OpcA [Verrucomicrobiaceae bacterium]